MYLKLDAPEGPKTRLIHYNEISIELRLVDPNPTFYAPYSVIHNSWHFSSSIGFLLKSDISNSQRYPLNLNKSKYDEVITGFLSKNWLF